MRYNYQSLPKMPRPQRTYYGIGQPIATYLIFIVTVLWFINEYVTYGSSTSTQAIYNAGGILGNQLSTTGQYWRLISPLFVHICVSHILSNMFMLLTVGKTLERLMGTFRFSILYFATGIAGNLLAAILSPNVVSAGASTALFGLLGYIVMDGLIRGGHVRRLAISYAYAILINLYVTFTNPSVSIGGHVGGFIAGLVLAIIIKPKYDN